jgi:DNA (cytosine-5)-methyltransferase 1
MNHGSLFSGGGGFDLAAEAMGWRNVFHCENDPFCRTILKHYWPDANTYRNIKEFNAQQYKGHIDIITGGFPCQPFSNSGKRRGTADDRYLWPEMLRIIKDVSPRWVVAENVYGLINWNEGVVFAKVKSDLEAEGYEVAPFILPATGVNAPHQRYRIWFIGFKGEKPIQTARRGKNAERLHTGKLEETGANTDSDGRIRGLREDEKLSGKGGKYAQRHALPLGDITPHSISQRLEGRKTKKCVWPSYTRKLGDWKEWPTQSPLCSGDDGLPTRLDGITFPQWRNKSVKMYGNAIVPQVALQIFQSIRDYEASIS